MLAKTVDFPCHRERKRGDPTEKVCDYVFRTLLQGIAAVATLLRNDIFFYVILSASEISKAIIIADG